MKKNIEPMVPDTFYHLYNRGINGETLFRSEQNYYYFLNKFAYYINPVATIYCYCLLRNHFHFLIKTRPENEIRIHFSSPKYDEKTASYIFSKQFSHLFNAYAQFYNRLFFRTGGLFEEPFRRKEINTEDYLKQTILYIHLNPLKHKICLDYQNYPYGSFHEIATGHQEFCNGDAVIRCFGNKSAFLNAHLLYETTFLGMTG